MWRYRAMWPSLFCHFAEGYVSGTGANLVFLHHSYVHRLSGKWSFHLRSYTLTIGGTVLRYRLRHIWGVAYLHGEQWVLGVISRNLNFILKMLIMLIMQHNCVPITVYVRAVAVLPNDRELQVRSHPLTVEELQYSLMNPAALYAEYEVYMTECMHVLCSMLLVV